MLPHEDIARFTSKIAAQRDFQFPSLRGQCYLDAAGAPPTPKAVHDEVHRLMTTGPTISNPHSSSPSGIYTEQMIEAVRDQVCRELFGISRHHQDQEQGWDLAFSSGATASLHLVASTFAFGQGEISELAYPRQAHTSLLGLRDVVHRSRAFDMERVDEILHWIRQRYNQLAHSECQSLLCLPLQCNATGRRYQGLLSAVLSLRSSLEQANGGRRSVYILLDAACYLSASSRLHLNATHADFIAFSFYKVLGHPMGLGGLIFRREAALQRLLAADGKRYYGGGTLDAIVSGQHWRKPNIRCIPKALEDGTLNTHGILAVRCALNALSSSDLLGADWQLRRMHVEDLTQHLWESLNSLRHADGSVACRVYSRRPSSTDHRASSDQGPIVLFNITHPGRYGPLASSTSQLIDPAEIERLACFSGVHLRVGRMCNIGAMTSALDISDSDIKALWQRGVSCGTGLALWSAGATALSQRDRHDELISSAVRVSLSVWSTREDVGRLVDFVQHFFITPSAVPNNDGFEAEAYDDEGNFYDCLSTSSGSEEVTCPSSPLSSVISSTEDSRSSLYCVKAVMLYPIKSCAGQLLGAGETWDLRATGLEHDRRFCIVDVATGKVMNQKKHLRMATIRPTVDRGAGLMKVVLAGEERIKFTVGLSRDSWEAAAFGSMTPSTRLSGEEQLPTPTGATATVSSMVICGRSLLPMMMHSDPRIRSLLSHHLGRSCALARFDECIEGGRKSEVPHLLSNESPFLAISEESVDQVYRWLQEEGEESGSDGGDRAGYAGGCAELTRERVAMTFRANFVLGSTSSGRKHEMGGDDCERGVAFWEDDVCQLSVGSCLLNVLGPCRRCEMIALDQVTGEGKPQVLRAIARHRRCRGASNPAYKGRLLFGIHAELSDKCGRSDGPFQAAVGMTVTPRWHDDDSSP